jgi:hypothetical protein
MILFIFVMSHLMNTGALSNVMKIYFVVFILLGLFQPVFSQKVYLSQYSSFCESDVFQDGKYLQERIKKIEKHNGFWHVEAIIIDGCGKKFFPVHSMKEDTLYIVMKSILKQTMYFDSNDSITEFQTPQECECAYVIKMEFNTDTIINIKINNKILPNTDEAYQIFPEKYWIFENDTTGFVDKYGRNQGAFVRKTDNYFIKTFYKDGKVTNYILFDIELNALLETKEIDDILYFKNE